MSEKYRTILTLQCRMTERVAAKCASGGAAGESRAQLPPAQAKLPTNACARTTVGVDYGKIRMHNICPVHVAGQMFAAVILKAQH
jgi:hypothetical protein